MKGEKDREREEPVVWRGKSSINMALARSDQIWLASLCLPCQFKESLQSSNKQHFSKVLLLNCPQPFPPQVPYWAGALGHLQTRSHACKRPLASSFIHPRYLPSFR